MIGGIAPCSFYVPLPFWVVLVAGLGKIPNRKNFCRIFSMESVYVYRAAQSAEIFTPNLRKDTMTTFFNFVHFFGNNSHSASQKRAKKQRQGRTCRFEELEGREMLSATPWALTDDVFNQCRETENATIIVYCTDTETASQIASAPTNALAAASAPIGSKSYSIDFSIGGTQRAYLTGLSYSEMISIRRGALNYLNVEPYDAEKDSKFFGIGENDTNHCWAGVAANMLAYTGWGDVNGFNTEYDIFSYFTKNFSDAGSRTDFGIEWFFTGNYVKTGWSGWAQPKSSGGNLYPEVDFDAIAGTNYTHDVYGLTAAVNKLEEGSAVGLSLGWYNSSHQRISGHAITLWGVIYDTSKSPTDPSYYKALLVSDSDDDKGNSLGIGGGSSAPNKLVKLNITWNATLSQYRFTNYSNGNGYLENFTWLASRNAEISSNIVTTLNDISNRTDGVISLREAIDNAKEGDTIRFDSSFYEKTIRLEGGEIEIKKNITIDATGLNITIDALGSSRVFKIAEGCNVTLIGLTITGGKSNQGGGIYNSGNLTLVDCLVAGNNAVGAKGDNGSTDFGKKGEDGKDGGHAYGGAIYNHSGTLRLIDTRIRDNEVTGGKGGNGGDGYGSATQMALQGGKGGKGGNAFGAGIYICSGTIILENCLFTGNTTKGGEGGKGGNGSGGLPLNKGGNGGVGGVGGSAYGGGIYFVAGELTLSSCIINENNSATGGKGGNGGNGGASGAWHDGSNGGNGGKGGDGLCGGIYNNTSNRIILTNCTVIGNTATFGSGGGGGNKGSKSLGTAGKNGTSGTAGKADTVPIFGQHWLMEINIETSNGGKISSSSIVVGETFSVTTGTIRNTGNTSSGNYTVTFYAADSTDILSGVVLGSVNMNSLASGASATATLNNISTLSNFGGLLPGSYRIGWTISAIVGETDKDNYLGYNLAPLTVIDALIPKADIPTITNHQQSVTYTQGQATTVLSVTATGNGELSYEWFQIGSETLLSTERTFAPPTDTVGIASYYCIVTNTLNGTTETATSETATITVLAIADTPTFSAYPQSATYEHGDTATALSVTASGNGDLTFQWYKDGAVIDGATLATYKPSTATVGSAEYCCHVTNTLNGTKTVQSETATITITPLSEANTPTITAHPQSATYMQRQTATALFVTANGNGELTYQWYKNGVAIDSATSDSYMPATATIGSAEYYCVVMNTLNGTKTAQSETVMVTIISTPVNKTLITNPKGTGYFAIKGVKNQSREATFSSLTFIWDSSKNATGKNAYVGNETVNILLYDAGGVKKGEKVASLSLNPMDFDTNGNWAGIAGGNLAITVTQINGKYTIKVSGLNAGTKYTAQIQAEGADKRLSKATTVAGTTKKYGVVRKDGKLLTSSPGIVEFAWKAVTGKDVPLGDKTYDVGIYVNNTFGYVFGGDIATFFGHDVKVNIDGMKVTITGLKAQKLIFGVKETTTVGDFSVDSAIAKVNATVK